MKSVLLGNDMIALVDDADFDIISRFKWQCHAPGRKNRKHPKENYYAYRAIVTKHICQSCGHEKVSARCKESMHKFILGDIPNGMMIDHVDGNGLNNQRHNLRICTQSQNNHNARKMRGRATSQYKGVHWAKIKNKWIAKLQIRNLDLSPKIICLGSFDNELEAAKAYDAAALKYFGNFARVNFPTIN